MTDPCPLPARRVFELVARAGGRRNPRGSIPANLAKALLRAPGLDRIAKSPRAFLETLTTPVTYDARNADALLPLLGVPACPPLESYIEKLVEYVQERVRQAGPRTRTSRSTIRSADGTMARKAVSPHVGEGMVVRRVVMAARQVVFFKGVVEASEGLAAVFAERGGDLTVASPVDRTKELDEVLDQLCLETGGVRVD